LLEKGSFWDLILQLVMVMSVFLDLNLGGGITCTYVLNLGHREVVVGYNCSLAIVLTNFVSKGNSGLELDLTGYRGTLFGLKMDPSWREIKQIL
jgi:hypothetical protein